ncbi:class I SAM-dependent methyltransferase [Rhizobium sp. BR 315]|uniref:class I SAM-dependent methyltransferase n=1 Tax=Rhizobium sp. BR 315 TaxID=3040014 RepID=UPI003D34171D
MKEDLNRATSQTIADFGDQWTTYTQNDGFYASQEMLRDILGPLVSVEELSGKVCAEVGAGTGRISQMLLRAGAAHVTAIEPSKAREVLARNLSAYGDRVAVLGEAGETFELSGLDFILSIGVLHHIPEPSGTVRNMHRSLAAGGRAVIWLYGREGNRAYLALAEPLRWITRRLPLWVNTALAAVLYPPLATYISLCRILPLPMRKYMLEVLRPIGGKAIRLVIVDQLNPRWAKYYTESEARNLLAESGFHDIQLHHRHGYSWTVSGCR